MQIPVLINGSEVGVLRLTREGLYTVFEAELPGCGEELVRLWAHGGGRSAYLGVMQPEGAGLTLHRRLSRRELAAFPDPVEFVSDREREEDDSLHNIDEEAGPEAPRDAEEPDGRSAASDARSCPWPAEVPEEGLLWYARPDGSLVSFDGISSLVAFPARLRSGGRGTEREIEGRKYLVFRY